MGQPIGHWGCRENEKTATFADTLPRTYWHSSLWPFSASAFASVGVVIWIGEGLDQVLASKAIAYSSIKLKRGNISARASRAILCLTFARFHHTYSLRCLDMAHRSVQCDLWASLLNRMNRMNVFGCLFSSKYSNDIISWFLLGSSTIHILL
jgi:hypothetical protein